MANELNMTVTLTYTPTDSAGEIVKVSPPAFSKTVTMSSNVYTTGTQDIGTSEEFIGDATNGLDGIFGASTALGYMLIKNVDDTNFVDIGVTTGVYTVRLKPGEFCLFRLSTADITTNKVYALADTATVPIQYWAFNL